MGEWVEYRLYRSIGANRTDPLRENYSYIRARVLPMVSRHAAKRCLILNYFEPGKRDYIRIRVEAKAEAHKALWHELESLRGSPEVHDVERETWSPEADARARVTSVLANLRAGGRDVWVLPGGTIEVPRDLAIWTATGMWARRSEEQMAKDLASMLVMVGDWSRQFVERFSRRPEEGFLLSLMIHLFLNSVGCSGPSHGEEAIVRFTPLVP